MEITDRVSRVIDDERNQDILKGILKEYRIRTGAGPATAAQVLKATIAIEDERERTYRGFLKFGSSFEDLHHIQGGGNIDSSSQAKK